MDDRRINSSLLPVVLGLALLAGFASTSSARGADVEPPQTYHERFEFDPRTNQWTEVAPPVPGTDAGDLAIARGLLAQRQFKKARKLFKSWFKVYPASPHMPEALFYSAEVEISAEEERPRSGNLIKAYKNLQELLQGWPGNDLFERALRKEMLIAELILFKHRKQKVWGFLWLSATEEALQMLDRIIDDFARETPIAEQALRMKADYHYQSGEFEEAELAYSRLLRDFPRGRYARFALLRSGESALGRFRGVEFDDADLLEAEVYFEDFEKRYPQDAESADIPQQLDRITEQRAEKDYLVARYYERVRKIDAAAFYYRWVMKTYPKTTWFAEARNRLIAIGGMEPPAVEEELPAASQPAVGMIEPD